MNMNMQNFEKLMDSKILSRGKDYYKYGHIASLEHNGKEWIRK